MVLFRGSLSRGRVHFGGERLAEEVCQPLELAHGEDDEGEVPSVGRNDALDVSLSSGLDGAY